MESTNKEYTTFSIFHLNIQSVRNKQEQLKALLIKENYDLIYLTKHFWNEGEVGPLKTM